MALANPQNPTGKASPQAERAEENPIVPFPGESASGSSGGVTAADFREPTPFSPAEMRRLRSRCEEYVRALTIRASVYLRTEFATPEHNLHIRTFRKLGSSFNPQTHITIFSVPGVKGQGYLEFPLNLAAAIVNRQMGGSAFAPAHATGLKEIEILVLNQFIQSVLAEWSATVPMIENAKAVLLGHESNPNFLEVPRENNFVVFAIQAQLDGTAGVFQLALPCGALEAFIRQAKGGSLELCNTDGPRHFTASEWNDQLDEVEVRASAHWPGIRLSTRILAELKRGDVVPLDPAYCQRVELRLANVPKFIGRLGTNGGKWAVEIMQVIRR